MWLTVIKYNKYRSNNSVLFKDCAMVKKMFWLN